LKGDKGTSGKGEKPVEIRPEEGGRLMGEKRRAKKRVKCITQINLHTERPESSRREAGDVVRREIGRGEEGKDVAEKRSTVKKGLAGTKR